MNNKEQADRWIAEHHDASLPNSYAVSSSITLLQGLVS